MSRHSHGRDNRLLVWQLRDEDEIEMDRSLPVDGVIDKNRQPWLLHAMPVNALNFCPFAMCYDGMPQAPSTAEVVEEPKFARPVLFAVPNAIDSGGVSPLPIRLSWY